VHVLKPLSAEDLAEVLSRALKVMDAAVISPEACQSLIDYADGDARRLLNALETVVDAAPVGPLIDLERVSAALGERVRRFDKNGDQFYDLISALHKSVRGSDPDAALYWFARMLDGGADPLYLGRRLIRMANEDIGLADPRALQWAMNAVQAYERLGSPEGELALAQAVVFLAMAPKSNAVYRAYKEVRAFVEKQGSREVPMKLRNASTRLMKDIGYAKGYRYAHDEPGGVVQGETYWPDDIVNPPRFYEPTDRGLELRIAERLRELRHSRGGEGD
jgi:putative ATPase